MPYSAGGQGNGDGDDNEQKQLPIAINMRAVCGVYLAYQSVQCT